jgi:hypothetical protein
MGSLFHLTSWRCALLDAVCVALTLVAAASVINPALASPEWYGDFKISGYQSENWDVWQAGDVQVVFEGSTRCTAGLVEARMRSTKRDAVLLVRFVESPGTPSAPQPGRDTRVRITRGVPAIIASNIPCERVMNGHPSRLWFAVME